MQAHLHLVARGAASVTLKPALAGYLRPEPSFQRLSQVEKSRGHAAPSFFMQAEHEHILRSGLACKLMRSYVLIGSRIFFHAVASMRLGRKCTTKL